MSRRGAKCVLCNQSAEVVGLHWYSAAHFCGASGTWLYTNYLLWSNDYKEITLVPRTVQTAGEVGEARQVDGEMLSNVIQLELPHPTPTA